MYTRLLFLFTLIGCSLLSAKAQQDSTKLFQKADELFATIKLPDAYADAINSSIEQQIKTTPALAGYKEDLHAFFEKCIGWSVLRTDVARLYLKYYTGEDIDAMVKFYQTPAGKKMAAVSAGVQKDLQALQQSTLQAHLGEWNQFITEKAKN